MVIIKRYIIPILSLFLIGGIFTAGYFQISADKYLFLSAILIFLTYLTYRLNSEPYLLSTSFALFFVLGGLLYVDTDLKDENILARFKGKKVQSIGYFTENPKTKNERLTGTFRLEMILVDSTKWNINQLLHITIDSIDESITRETRLFLTSFVNTTRPNNNPDVFDYRRHQYYRHIRFATWVEADKYVNLGRPNSLPAIEGLKSTRDTLLQILEHYLEDDDAIALASAMLLGYRNKLSDEIYTAFTETGAVHVLAVSGLHVGIVADFLLCTLGFFRKKSKIISIITYTTIIILIWLYAIISGAAPSVIRASIMFTLYVLYRALKIGHEPLNIVGITAIGLLVYDPFLLFQASFLFSFTALLGILTVFPEINKLITTRNKVLRWILQAIGISIAAQLFVAPFVIFFYHKLPLWFILSGLFAVLGAYAILFGGVILFVLHFIVPKLAAFLAPLYEFVVQSFQQVIFWTHKLPFSSIKNIWLDDTSLALLYMIIISGVYIIKTGRITSLKYLLLAGILFYLLQIKKDAINRSINKLVVYDVYKGSIADIMSDGILYSYNSENITEKGLKYIAENHRSKLGYTSAESISILDSFEAKNIKKTGRHIQLNNKILQLGLDGNRISNAIDRLILTSSDLSQIYDTDYSNFRGILILDNSFKFGKQRHLISYFEKKGINSYSTQVSGAYEEKL